MSAQHQSAAADTSVQFRLILEGPMLNPRLDIRAMRKRQAVEASTGDLAMLPLAAAALLNPEPSPMAGSPGS